MFHSGNKPLRCVFLPDPPKTALLTLTRCKRMTCGYAPLSQRVLALELLYSKQRRHENLQRALQIGLAVETLGIAPFPPDHRFFPVANHLPPFSFHPDYPPGELVIRGSGRDAYAGTVCPCRPSQRIYPIAFSRFETKRCLACFKAVVAHVRQSTGAPPRRGGAGPGGRVQRRRRHGVPAPAAPPRATPTRCRSMLGLSPPSFPFPYP